jgi:DNA-binding transcriptional MerR regulator
LNLYDRGVRRYTIGEAAGRSGFSASALRYYEGIGLVEPSARSEGGYRLYDDAALARLAFIARAKQLGCSLEEITDLVSIWDGDRCGPVQRRFHDLVSGKIRDAQSQVIELTAFTSQLRAAAEQLSGEPIDGPCGPDCACVAGETPTAAIDTSMVALGRKPGAVPVDVPIACTLEPGAMPDRMAEWSRVLAAATRRVAVAGGLRIEFGPDVDPGELGRLVGAEQRCCSFFSFTLTVDAAGTALEVRAPELAAGIVADLFGAPA